MELDERDLLNKIKEMERLEKDILRMTEEIADYMKQSKVSNFLTCQVERVTNI